MGQTKRERLRRAGDCEQRFGVDSSKVLLRFADDWSIRQITSYAEAAREGSLMSNCFLPNDEDDLVLDAWMQHPETSWYLLDSDSAGIEVRRNISRVEAGDYVWLDKVWPLWGNLEHFDLSLTWPGFSLSLRDPDNLPHATFDQNNGETLGRHNSALKPAYARYWDRWDDYFSDCAAMC